MLSDSNGKIFLAACTTAVLVHFHIAGPHVIAALKKLPRYWATDAGKRPEDSACVEEKMEKLRAASVRHGFLAFCHLDLVYSLLGFWDFLQSPTKPRLLEVAISTLFYGAGVGIGSGYLQNSRWMWFVGSFVFLPLCDLSTWDLQEFSDFDAITKFCTTVTAHLVASVFYLDISISIPSAVLHTCTNVASFIYFRGSSQVSAVFMSFIVFNLLMRIIVLSVLETAVRSFLGSHRKLEEAHCMIAGFQQILKGMCDGSLLLDQELRIHGSTNSLQQLLMDRKDFAGTDFESLILDASGRERFAAFIKASSAATSEPRVMTAPSCLRLALKSGSGGVVSLDTFHAAVPGLSGSKEPYHLLAFLEDTDSRPEIPAPPGGVPQPWRWPQFGTAPAHGPLSSQASSRASTAGSGAMDALETLQVVRELEEATFVIDSQTEELTILEAHLKFVKAPTDVEFKLHLPSVKSISRHTDWPNLQRDLTHYAHRLRRGAAPDLPARLRPLRVCIPGNPRKYLKSEYTMLSCANRIVSRDGPLFLHLHLKNFNKSEAYPTRPVSRLQGFAFQEEEEQSDDDGRSSAAASSGTT